jgi:bifunctional DNase/RNase
MGVFHPIDVVGVRVEMPSNQPIVLVREREGVRYLPIWVGAVEATAIAFAQQAVIPPRPLTHDLMKAIIEEVALPVEAIHLTELKDGIFYAEIRFSGGKVISARPSDALAVGLRLGAPLFASENLFEKAGIEIPDQSEDEVEKFKEFLDHINPEDFAG